jgi:protein tyrosine/serine phosphatase
MAGTVAMNEALRAGTTQGRPLEGVDNFRDFGGQLGRFGRVRAGRLFRSAHWARATSGDLGRLASLDLVAVTDLRRPTERQRAPNRLPQGFRGRVIANDDGDRAEAPHVAFLRQGDLSDAAVERFLLDYYRQSPFEARHLDLFARTFQVLAQSDGAVLVHCTAGKDRTGLLAALVQRAAGVHRDDVLADYLATNAAMMTADRVEAARRDLMALTGAEPSPIMITGFLGVETRHLEAAFASIETRAGGLDAYLAALGVGPKAIDSVRARLIA